MNVNLQRRTGQPGPPIPRLLVNFFNVFFFQSDRPTQYQALNEKKGGMSLHWIQVIMIRHEDTRREGLAGNIRTIRASTPVNKVNLKLKFTPV